MNRPLVIQIIKLHAVHKTDLNVNDLVTVKIDHIYIQDGNSPTLTSLCKHFHITKVFDPTKISFFFDHSVLSINSQISLLMKESLLFARQLKANIFSRGEGISHLLALENYIFQPMHIVLGSDSHTCTGGVYQCLSLGMGISDILSAMITGYIWLKIPETINIHILGIPHVAFRSKDLVLYFLKIFSPHYFLYKSIELTGTWIQQLSSQALTTITNMAVELGAKCLFVPNKVPIFQNINDYEIAYNEAKTLTVNISGLIPQIAKPHNPVNVVDINQIAGLHIDYVFLGSCTNAQLEDLKEIAMVLQKKDIHTNIHCIITPGTKNIYLQAIQKGYIQIMIKAGAIITPPGCGPCIGTQGSIPANDDNILTTMNRNYLGRMGNAKANIYLSSPLIAIHTACLGVIPDITYFNHVL